ncbi:hypothetical protein AAG570_004022 [Ranatra chinensis]|uniref:Uncharacterized protein n=1 Tax=Ranatra chinensis TaxID=642074 RepID=A0ABD0Y2K2_9HEMI
MASKRRNIFYQNKKQESTEIGQGVSQTNLDVRRGTVGISKNSDRIQAFQSKVLRTILDAPWEGISVGLQDTLVEKLKCNTSFLLSSPAQINADYYCTQKGQGATADGAEHIETGTESIVKMRKRSNSVVPILTVGGRAGDRVAVGRHIPIGLLPSDRKNASSAIVLPPISFTPSVRQIPRFPLISTPVTIHSAARSQAVKLFNFSHHSKEQLLRLWFLGMSIPSSEKEIMQCSGLYGPVTSYKILGDPEKGRFAATTAIRIALRKLLGGPGKGRFMAIPRLKFDLQLHTCANKFGTAMAL